MDASVIPIRLKRDSSRYDIAVGACLLEACGSWAGECLADSGRKILIVSNRRVFGLYGETVRSSLARAGFQTFVHLIGDGERFKNMRTLESILVVLSKNKFSRIDAVAALGGGVVGDVTGFAAATFLRGIGFLQIPTTLLSMIDSSVGGKTGINTPYGKNLVGSFYQPKGVLIDIETLRTLPRRELTAGFCEAVKHGAIGGRSLLNQTSDFLSRYGIVRIREHFSGTDFRSQLSDLVRRQIGLKARIVQNDERELTSNTSPTSRKVLNFGHTFAHAIEKATDYKYLKHGEAVGYGISFAAELSKRLELLAPDEVDLLNDVVRRAGTLPAISHIDPSKVLEAFRYDKKQIGDSLHWILLRGIGKPVIVQGSAIPRRALTSTLKYMIDTRES